jgi:amino acid adenylation domain-containing protein
MILAKDPTRRPRSASGLATPGIDEGPAGRRAGSPSPLAFGQRSLWFVHQLAPSASVYNIAAAARSRTPIDADLLEHVLQTLVDRHDALRTTFLSRDGEPCQVTAARSTFRLGREDAADWDEARLRRRLADEAWRPFDLERGPLLRFTLFTGCVGGPVLLLVIHHIIADFWSLAILMRELSELYREGAGGAPARLAPPGLAYAEHVRRERESLGDGRGEALLAYWRRQLAGLPVLALETDRPRPAVQTYQGDSWRATLPDLATALRARAREQHGTLFVTLVAAVQVLLGRHSGQEDFAIGSPTAGRSHTAAAGTVGYFVNPVVLRGDLSGDPSFAELHERTRDVVSAGLAHGDCPLPLLAERLQPDRDGSRTPFFQLSFVLQKETRGVSGLTAFALGEEGVEIALGPLQLQSLALARPPAPFDLQLQCVERQGGLSLALQYNTDLFDPATAARLVARLETLLRAIAAGVDLPVSALPLLPEAERHQLVHGWNDTAAPGREANLFDLFAAQAARSPQATAVVFEDQRVSYGELAARAAALAERLAEAGVGPEVLVGVFAQRSVELVVAVLAVLAAGGAYVPLEPDLPRRRLEMILAHAQPAVVLVQPAVGGELPPDAAPQRIELDGPSGPGATAAPRRSLLRRAEPDNAAYVIFTSGSTGRPKGVVNTHRGIINRLLWMQESLALDASDRVLHKTPFGFDVSVGEIFAPLLAGGRLIVARPGGHRDSAYLVRLIAQEAVTTLHFVPSMLPFFLAAEGVAAAGSALRRVLVSGEALPWDVEQRCLALLPVPLLNLYGPTEAAVEVTAWACQRTAELRAVPIGRPIDNTRVALLGRRLELAPAGAAAELVIGGTQVARGYLGRPDLTAELFVPDPYSATPGARVYRTGDLCRHRHDGAIEFLGRLDDQVKIRGFRIEPREIELALAAHPLVREAAVVVRGEPGAERSLLACVVQRGDGPVAATAAALRDFLSARLPAYMVPAFAFGPELDGSPRPGSLTRLPSGKLDRGALARWLPAAAEERPHRAPATPVEEIVAGFFAEVLGLDRVGVDEGFFDLGGHSLSVMRLTARVRETFGVELAPHRIFELPSVAGLAGEIARLAAEAPAAAGIAAAPALLAVPRTEPLPFSFAQQRLWFLHQLAPQSAVYNVPAVVDLRGQLQPAVLAAALGEVARRHESLRTRLVGGVEGPVQAVDPPAAVALPVVDLAGLPAAARPREARRLARAEARRAFDLGSGPLVRAAVVALGAAEQLLLLTLHHAVCDGWSLRLLAHELGVTYGAVALRAAPRLPPLAVQYGDYAVWQRRWFAGERLAAELAYWRHCLAGAPSLLELSFDRPRPAAASDRGATHPLQLPAGLLPSLETLARRQGATLFMTLLAAFQALLARTAGVLDLCVGTPVAGRREVLVEPLIGCFVNMLVLRADLSGDPRFEVLLARTRGIALAAYAHQDLPFEKLVEELQPRRDLSHSPLFQVAFSVEASPPRLELGELSAALWPDDPVGEKFDLSLALRPTATALGGTFSFRTDLFDGASIARLAGHFGNLLAGAATAPHLPLSALPLLGDGERHQVSREWSDTWTAGATADEGDAGLAELCAAQAARTPHAVAVDCGDTAMTYAELDRRSNQLAHRLRRLGVGPESLVGVLMERSADLVVALLGVHKSGGAYLPLDPIFPAERLAWMAGDAALALLLTETPLAASLAAAAVPTLLVDRERPALGAESAAPPPPWAAPDNLAYVIFTSGSTGRPKGVAVTRRALSNFLGAMRRRPGLAADDNLLAVTTISFDIAALEIFLPLTVGARVTLARRDEAADGAALAHQIASRGATVMQATPATWQMLLSGPAPQSLALRAFCGGEALPPGLAAELAARTRGVWNLYGPTETTVWSACALLDRQAADAVVTVGRPIANTRIVLLDRTGHPVPIGAAGHLHIGGTGLARGYLHRPDLTAERFVPDPLAADPGARLYGTGDLARFLADGRLVCLGRIDHQVKLRGFRIELGEIEAALRRHPEVEQAAVVLAAGNDPADSRLAAYVVGSGGGAPDAEMLRRFLSRTLPVYMIPSSFTALAALPLGASGKIDRRALDALGRQAPRPPAGAGGRAPKPKTIVEELLAAIFAAVLQLDEIGADDDFFALGGHSLSATQVAARARAVLGVELPVRALFEAPTVAALAAWIESRADAAGAEPPRSPKLARRTGPAPLSFAQRRLWFLDRLEPGSAAYHLPAALAIEGGALDAAALHRSLAAIVERHEILRTVFIEEDGREPEQHVLPGGGAVQMPLIDLAALPAASGEREALRLGRAEASRPFDFSHGPLYRFCLLRRGPASHLLLATLHHIVADGWSLRVWLAEVSSRYRELTGLHAPPLPELPVQYGDYADWQRRRLAGAELERLLSYWRGELAGVPPLELPADRPRPPVASSRGATLLFNLPEPQVRALRLLGRRQGATPFMVLLSVFQVLVARLSGQDDLALGTPVAGRERAELEPLIGCFINVLVLRSRLPQVGREGSFEALLRAVREALLEAQAYQDLPLERLIEELQPERSLNRSPLFQTLLSWQPSPLLGAQPLADLTLRPVRIERGASQLDLSLEVVDEGREYEVALEYSSDLFDEPTAARIGEQLRVLLAAACAAPVGRWSELPLLTVEQRRQVLVAWNAAAAPRAAICLHTLFERTAESLPDAPAVRFGGEDLSYADLERRANRLANRLQSLGVGPDTLVGICAERSFEMIVGLLGILKAGGAFVPLEPDHPRERLAFVLAEARPLVVLAEGHCAELLPPGTPILALPAAAAGDERPACAASPRSLAYALYTSGSSGHPKGVMVSHAAIANHVQWMQERFPLAEGDTLLQHTPLSFDASLVEIFPPLAAGARVVMALPGEHHDPSSLVGAAADEAVTVLQVVPAMLAALLDDPRIAALGRLRRIICGGEALASELAERVLARLDVELVNHYGPTECAIDAAFRPCRRAAAPGWVPLGLPLANVRLHVLDEALEPLPLGAAGELWVGGACLARGYLDRPDLTAERFLPDPWSAAPGERLYRTGDRARRLPDGEIAYLGRLDHQLKVRGVRIEPDEVERALGRVAGVKEAAVAQERDAGGAATLLAWVVAAAGGAPSPEVLRRALRASLPEPMVPSRFIAVAALPRTASGKLDRRALPAPPPLPARPPGEPATAGVAAHTQSEELLAGIFAEVLGVERVDVEDDFFSLGGHSLLATRVAARVRAAFGVELPLRQLFDTPALGQLARWLEAAARQDAPGRPALPPLARAARQEPLPLSFAQRRLWLVEQLAPPGGLYNIPGAVRLSGPLSLPALAAALATAVARHEALRTTIVTHRGEPVQLVHAPDAARCRMPLIDLRALPETVREHEARRLAGEEARRRFDLARGPLLRTALLALGATDHLALLTLHHIVSDGWSMGVLLHELGALYAAFLAGRSLVLPELPLQYADYAAWQRRCLTDEWLAPELAYWRRQLAARPPALELPFDRPRRGAPSALGSWLPLALPGALVGELRRLARARGATLFMTLLAGFAALLGRLGDQDDLTLGTPVAGRTQVETEGLIGFFVNLLVLRADLAGDPGAGELLERIREVVLAAHAHQEIPFDELAEALEPQRADGRPPLFQVMFSFEELPPEPFELPGLVSRYYPVETGTAKFDLTVALSPAPGGGLTGGVEIAADLFDRATGRRLAAQYQALLAHLGAAPGEPLSALPLLSGAERAQLLTADGMERHRPRRPARAAGARSRGGRGRAAARCDGGVRRAGNAVLRRARGAGLRPGLALARPGSRAGGAGCGLRRELPRAGDRGARRADRRWRIRVAVRGRAAGAARLAARRCRPGRGAHRAPHRRSAAQLAGRASGDLPGRGARRLQVRREPRGLGGAAGERRERRQPRLCHLHLRLDGPAQGGRHLPWRARQPGALAPGPVRRHGRRPRHADGEPGLRCLGLGAVAVSVRRRERPHRCRGSPSLRGGDDGLVGTGGDHPRLCHDAARRAGAGGARAAAARPSCPAGGGGSPPPRRRARWPVPVDQPLRAVGVLGGSDGRRGAAGGRRPAPAAVHRPADRQHPHLCAGPRA